jgi:tetratricopeptide (TPR) repeat protein
MRDEEKNYALYQKGLEALERGSYERVLKISEKLHVARYSGAFELEARARYEMGDPQEATRILEMGLRKTPGVYILASYLGEYQSNQGHYQLAIEAFDKARDGDQDTDSYADLNIGVCYARMEMYDRAAEYYRKVRFSEGYHGWLFYWTCKAKLEWSLGNHDQFLRDCEEGIALANREHRQNIKKQAAWIYAYRAEYYIGEGKRAPAEADLKAAKMLDSHLEQVLYVHRLLYGRRLAKATSHYVVLKGTAAGLRGMPKKIGMIAWFYIIAESEIDLVRLAQQHAEEWQTWEEVVEIRSTKEFQDVYEGVTRMQVGGGLAHQFGLFHRLRARLSGIEYWKHD